MAAFIKDHDFVNEFLFAAPTPATYTERSFPGDTLWLVSEIALFLGCPRCIHGSDPWISTAPLLLAALPFD